MYHIHSGEVAFKTNSTLNNHHYSLFYNNALIRWLAVMSFSTPVRSWQCLGLHYWIGHNRHIHHKLCAPSQEVSLAYTNCTYTLRSLNRPCQSVFKQINRSPAHRQLLFHPIFSVIIHQSSMTKKNLFSLLPCFLYKLLEVCSLHY